MVELRLPNSQRPEPMVLFTQDGDWPVRLALRAVPGGGLNLVLEQSGTIEHRTLNPTESGRTDLLRLTYSWDAPRRWGRLALERVDGGLAQIVDLKNPRPWRLADLKAMLQPSPFRFVSSDVQYLALSDQIEPVGPMPSLAEHTPIATPQGYRSLATLQRGDLVLAGDGTTVPVLHVVRRSMPTLGSFHPIRLRAPYFGLQQDIDVAPSQRLVLSGSEVEYLFGQQSVLVPARHLLATHTALQPMIDQPVKTFMQLLLPDHAAPLAAGAVVESLFIGRLRRDKTRLAASLLAEFDRSSLPEHGRSKYPVLRSFDATVLAERRIA
ncbi:hypothetical protein EBB79_21195 [Parasedimentitalea marina]|uniref:Hedgehog/Intein (Hint) domain-containing protein n=1 Tax=Parasedimentitalea marina TaxID=2483033 RepID=A0A3T0N966_9RHOB|nr:Hint domain-containing protein [Parasedimentitalea marina]AZV80567.1 hypothetical protein EBB79_21195 [Parasedimentitalea marina]